MRVAFHTEGRTDEEVLPRLVETILGAEVEPTRYQRRSGGVAEVLKTIHQALWDAWHSGCLGAIIAVDADATTPHDAHGGEGAADCRYCRVSAGLPSLPKQRAEGPLFIAVAVPVQAIEAWLLELARRPTPGPPQRLDRREAKRYLYGSQTPSPGEIRRVCEEVLPRIDRAALDQLADRQPSFRSFRDEVLRFRPAA